MEDTLKKIAETIGDVAVTEDAELRRIAYEGIFFMPELAFAYACGKAIMENKHEIFGDDIPCWQREVDLKNGGPTDLVFEYENKERIAIEFKLRDTHDAYIKDLNKLDKLDSKNTAKIFCALTDTFTSMLPNDERIQEVEKHFNGRLVSLLEKKPIFPTIEHWYQRDVTCIVCVWALGKTPVLVQ